MTGDRSILRKATMLFALSALLVIVVLVRRPSAAPATGEDRSSARRTSAVVIKSRPGGAIECSDLAATKAEEATVLYHWSGRRLETTRCHPAPAGLIGLGPS